MIIVGGTLFPIPLSCSPVAADKAGTGRIERCHDIKNQCIDIGGCRISGNGNGIEGVDTGLNEQVGNRKNCILDSRRDAEHQYHFGSICIHSDF